MSGSSDISDKGKFNLTYGLNGLLTVEFHYENPGNEADDRDGRSEEPCASIKVRVRTNAENFDWPEIPSSFLHGLRRAFLEAFR